MKQIVVKYLLFKCSLIIFKNIKYIDPNKRINNIFIINCVLPIHNICMQYCLEFIYLINNCHKIINKINTNYYFYKITIKLNNMISIKITHKSDNKHEHYIHLSTCNDCKYPNTIDRDYKKIVTNDEINNIIKQYYINIYNFTL